MNSWNGMAWVRVYKENHLLSLFDIFMSVCAKQPNNVVTKI